ncbi:unnamed protein product [Rotaria socialis]
MSATAAGRPVLKNLTRARVPKAGLIGFSIAAAAALVVKHFVSDKHKDDMRTFYNNYDPERDYARMKASGVFKSLASQQINDRIHYLLPMLNHDPLRPW